MAEQKPPITVDIEGIGPVDFPGDMSMEDITARAKTLSENTAMLMQNNATRKAGKTAVNNAVRNNFIGDFINRQIETKAPIVQKLKDIGGSALMLNDKPLTGELGSLAWDTMKGMAQNVPYQISHGGERVASKLGQGQYGEALQDVATHAASALPGLGGLASADEMAEGGNSGGATSDLLDLAMSFLGPKLMNKVTRPVRNFGRDTVYKSAIMPSEALPLVDREGMLAQGMKDKFIPGKGKSATITPLIDADLTLYDQQVANRALTNKAVLSNIADPMRDVISKGKGSFFPERNASGLEPLLQEFLTDPNPLANPNHPRNIVFPGINQVNPVPARIPKPPLMDLTDMVQTRRDTGQFVGNKNFNRAADDAAQTASLQEANLLANRGAMLEANRILPEGKETNTRIHNRINLRTAAENLEAKNPGILHRFGPGAVALELAASLGGMAMGHELYGGLGLGLAGLTSLVSSPAARARTGLFLGDLGQGGMAKFLANAPKATLLDEKAKKIKKKYPGEY